MADDDPMDDLSSQDSDPEIGHRLPGGVTDVDVTSTDVALEIIVSGEVTGAERTLWAALAVGMVAIVGNVLRVTRAGTLYGEGLQCINVATQKGDAKAAIITPCTVVRFISKEYIVAVSLDVSPSVSIVDPISHSLIFNEIFKSFERVLYQLVQPVAHHVDDAAAAESPIVWLSVLAYTDRMLHPEAAVSMLLSNARANPATASALCSEVRRRLVELELVLSAIARPAPAAPPLPALSSAGKPKRQSHSDWLQKRDSTLNQSAIASGVAALESLLSASARPAPAAVVPRPSMDDGVEQATAPQLPQGKNDFGLDRAVTSSVAALRQIRRPADAPSASIVIIITDGVVAFRDPRQRTTTLERLTRFDVACSFLQIGQTDGEFQSFGHVPDTELLLHIAAGSGGSVVFDADLTKDNGHHNVGGTTAQRAFLFPAAPCCGRPTGTVGMSEESFLANEYIASGPAASTSFDPSTTQRRLHSSDFSVPLLRRRCKRYVVEVPNDAVLDHRVRHGWRVESMLKVNVGVSLIATPMPAAIPQSQRQEEEVTLVRAFGPNIRIETVLSTCASPEGSEDRLPLGGSTQVRLDLVAPYEFHVRFGEVKRCGQGIVESGSWANAAHLCRVIESISKLDQELGVLWNVITSGHAKESETKAPLMPERTGSDTKVELERAFSDDPGRIASSSERDRATLWGRVLSLMDAGSCSSPLEQQSVAALVHTKVDTPRDALEMTARLEEAWSDAETATTTVLELWCDIQLVRGVFWRQSRTTSGATIARCSRRDGYLTIRTWHALMHRTEQRNIISALRATLKDSIPLVHVLSTSAAGLHPEYTKYVMQPSIFNVGREVVRSMSVFAAMAFKWRCLWTLALTFRGLDADVYEDAMDEISDAFATCMQRWVLSTRLDRGESVGSLHRDLTVLAIEANSALVTERSCLIQTALSTTVYGRRTVFVQETWVEPVTDVFGGDIEQLESTGSWFRSAATAYANEHRFARQLCTFLVVWSLCESSDDGAASEKKVSLSSMSTRKDGSGSTVGATPFPHLIAGGHDTRADVVPNFCALLEICNRHQFFFPRFVPDSGVCSEQVVSDSDGEVAPPTTHDVAPDPCHCANDKCLALFADSIADQSHVEIVLTQAEQRALSATLMELGFNYSASASDIALRSFCTVDMIADALFITVVPLHQPVDGAGGPGLTVFAFECQRMAVTSTVGPLSPRRPIQTFDCSVSLAEAIEPCIGISKTDTERQHARLASAFVQSYINTVFSQLQDGHSVPEEAITHVTDACVNREFEINITPFLKETAISGARRIATAVESPAYDESVRARFRSILNLAFMTNGTDFRALVRRRRDSTVEPAVDDTAKPTADVTEQQLPNQSVEMDSLPMDNVEIGLDDFLFSDLQRHLEFSEKIPDMMTHEPFLMSVECTVRKTAKSGVLFKSVLLNDFPVSIWDLVDEETDNTDNLVEALLRGDVTVILILTAFVIGDFTDTTSESETTDTATDGGSDGPFSEDAGWMARRRTTSMGESTPDTPLFTPFPSPLSPENVATDVIRALDQLKGDIQWLLEDEMLSLSRRHTKLTAAVVRRTIAHLNTPSPIETQSRTNDMTLAFVDMETGPELFSSEIAFESLVGCRTFQFDDIVCIVPSRLDFDTAGQGSSPLTDYQDGGSAQTLEYPPFYLLLHVEPHAVTALLHTRALEYGYEHQLLDNVASLVSQTERNVNELLLLEEVDTTKVCPDNFVVPPPDQPQLIPAFVGGGDRGPTFSCRLVFQREFGLHGRLPSATALASISRALHVIRVKNRPDQFVYREQTTKAVYMLHFEVDEKRRSSMCISDTDSNHSGAATPPRLGMVIGTSTPPRPRSLGTATPPRLSRGASSDHLGGDLATRLSELRPRGSMLAMADTDSLGSDRGDWSERAIVLLVFGVRDVGSSIGKDLVEMVSKVIDEAALDVLSEKLFRNSSLRLMHDDVAFLQQPGPVEARIEVPRVLVGALPSWRTYLQQDLHLYMRPYFGPDLFLDSEDGARPTSTSPLQVASVYIRVNSKPTAKERVPKRQPKRFGRGETKRREVDSDTRTNFREQAAVVVGAGAALIAVDILETIDATTSSDLTTEEHVLRYLRSDPLNDTITAPIDSGASTSNTTSVSVRVRAWGRGGMRIPLLLEMVKTSVAQALIEAIMEQCVLDLPLTVPSLPQPNHVPDAPQLNLSIVEILQRISEREEVGSFSSIRVGNYTVSSGRSPAVLEQIPTVLHSMGLQIHAFRGVPSTDVDGSSATRSEFTTASEAPRRGSRPEFDLNDVVNTRYVSYSLNSNYSPSRYDVPPPSTASTSQRPGCVHGQPNILLASDSESWTSGEDGLFADIKGSSAGDEERSDLGSPLFGSVKEGGCSRRRLVVVISINDSIRVVMYNLVAAVARKCTSWLSNIVQWENCRAHFLARVLHAKMGLLQHAPFAAASSSRSAASMSLRCESMAELRLLLECPHLPKSEEFQALPKASFAPQDVVAEMSGAAPRNALQESRYGDDPDPVRRHGMQLQATVAAHRQAEQFDAGVTLFQEAWGHSEIVMSIDAPETKQSSRPQSVTPEQTIAVVRSMRPTHYCATPVLDDSVAAGDDVTQQTWRRSVMEEWRLLYCKYVTERLPFIDMCTVHGESGRGEEECGATTYLQYQRDFLKGGGMIVFEVTSRGSFSCVKMYTWSTPVSLIAPRSNDSPFSDTGTRRDFSEDCALMKDLMHVNSFGYDFTIYSLVDCLRSRSLPYPDFPFVRTLLQLHESTRTLPQYRHNIVEYRRMPLPSMEALGIAESDYTSLAVISTVTNALFGSPETYGMSQIVQTNVNNQVNRFIFSCRETVCEGNQCALALVIPFDQITRGDNDATEGRPPTLTFFVVHCNLRDRFPGASAHARVPPRNRLGQPQRDDGRVFELTTSAAGESIETAVKELEAIMVAVLHHRHRDRLWAAMVVGLGGSTEFSSLFEYGSLETLVSLTTSTYFDVIDPDAAALLDLPVVWTSLLELLQEHFHLGSHLLLIQSAGVEPHQIELGDNPDEFPHIILFAWNRDIIAHLWRDSATNKLRGQIMSRIPIDFNQSRGNPDTDERIQFANPDVDFRSDALHHFAVVINCLVQHLHSIL